MESDIFREVFSYFWGNSGYFSSLKVFLQSIGTYLIPFGLIMFILQFFYYVAKNEIQFFDQIISFIFSKGTRFLLIVAMLMPIKIGSFSTEGLPLSLYIYKFSFEAGLASADKLTALLHSKSGITTFAKLPFLVKERESIIKENLKDLADFEIEDNGDGTATVKKDGKTVYNDYSFLTGGEDNKNASKKVTSGIVSIIIAIAFGLLSFFTAGAGAGVGTAVLGTLKATGIAGATSDFVVGGVMAGEPVFITPLRNLFLNAVIPASLVMLFVGTSIIMVLRIIMCAFSFYLSTIFLFFESTKNTFVSNVIKSLVTMLYPLSITVAYSVSVTSFTIFQPKLTDFVSKVFANAPGISGLLSSIILFIISISAFISIYKTLIKFAETVIDNFFGTNAFISYQGK